MEQRNEKLSENLNDLNNQKIYYQPCLFTDGSEISTLRNDCNGLLSKLNNLRRGVFKRLDDMLKSIKELMIRQDERDLEMERMQSRIEKLEADLYNSKNNHIPHMVHIVGRKPNAKPLYMMGKGR